MRVTEEVREGIIEEEHRQKLLELVARLSGR